MTSVNGHNPGVDSYDHTFDAPRLTLMDAFAFDEVDPSLGTTSSSYVGARAYTIAPLGESWNDPDVKLTFVLEDLMLDGGLTIAYGDGGIGKSTSFRRFTMQAARGGSFFGRKFTRQCRVMHLAFETMTP